MYKDYKGGNFTCKLYSSNKSYTKTSLRVIFRTLEPKIIQTFCLESKRLYFFRGWKCRSLQKWVREIPSWGLDSKAKKLYDELDVINMECPAAEKKIGTFLIFFRKIFPGGYPASLSWNFICVAGICIYIIFRWQYQITLLFNSYWPMLRLDSRVRSDFIFFCSSGTNSEGSSGGCAATSQGPQTITQPARHFLVSSWRKTGWWKKTTLLS